MAELGRLPLNMERKRIWWDWSCPGEGLSHLEARYHTVQRVSEWCMLYKVLSSNFLDTVTGRLSSLHILWRTRGRRDARLLPQKFLIFMHFRENWPNNRLVPHLGVGVPNLGNLGSTTVFCTKNWTKKITVFIMVIFLANIHDKNFNDNKYTF